MEVLGGVIITQTVKEEVKGLVEGMGDRDAILMIAYMRSLGGERYTDAEVAISALDKLCGEGERL